MPRTPQHPGHVTMQILYVPAGYTMVIVPFMPL